MFNEICNIEVEGAFTEFTCRRFVKENNLSKIRSDARKKGHDKNKTTTKRITMQHTCKDDQQTQPQHAIQYATLWKSKTKPAIKQQQKN